MTAHGASAVDEEGHFKARLAFERTGVVVAIDASGDFVGAAVVATSPKIADTTIDISPTSTAATATYLFSGSAVSHPEATAILLARLRALPELARLAGLLGDHLEQRGSLALEGTPTRDLRLGLQTSIQAFNAMLLSAAPGAQATTRSLALSVSEDDDTILRLEGATTDGVDLTGQLDGNTLALTALNTRMRWVAVLAGDAAPELVGYVYPASFDLPTAVIDALLDSVKAIARAVWDTIVGGQDLIDALKSEFAALYGKHDATRSYTIDLGSLDAARLHLRGPGFSPSFVIDDQVLATTFLTAVSEVILPIMEIVADARAPGNKYWDFVSTNDLTILLANKYGSKIGYAIVDLMEGGSKWSFTKAVVGIGLEMLTDGWFIEWLARSAGGGMLISEATADAIQSLIKYFGLKLANPFAGADFVLRLIDYGVAAGFLGHTLAVSPTLAVYELPQGGGGTGTPTGGAGACADGDGDGACATTDCDDSDPTVQLCSGGGAAADTDGDCVPDGRDHCPGTAPSMAVDGSGCTALDWLDPCDPWPTHGAFVSRFAMVVTRWVEDGLLPGPAGAYISQAARSGVGMPASAGKATDCEALRELLNVSSAQVCEPAYSDGTPLPTAPSTGDGSSDAAEVILCLTGSACTLTQDYLTVGSWNPTQGDVHAGLDYGTGAGVETLAGVAGEVIRVDPTGLGLIAIYLPERDLTLVFLHMSAIDVVTGQVVTPTTVVGRTGAVGTPGGAHLHVELRLGRRGYAVGEPSGEVAAITLHPAEVVDCQ